MEEEARIRQSTSTCWQGSPIQLSYLNLDFMIRAHQWFDDAERAVTTDAQLLRRTRRAAAVGPATPSTWKLMSDWLARHGGAENFPLDREAVGARLATWCAEIDRRVRPSAKKLTAEGEIRRFAMVPTTVNLPEKFRGLLPRHRLRLHRDDDSELCGAVKVVKDPQAESGITNRLDLTAADVTNPQRYVLLMPWGLYATVEQKGLAGAAIKAEEIPGPGYHWYRLGTFPVKPGYYVLFLELDHPAGVDNVFDPAKPDQKFDLGTNQVRGTAISPCQAGGEGRHLRRTDHTGEARSRPSRRQSPACSSWCRRAAAKRSIETMRSANVGSVKPGMSNGSGRCGRGPSPWAQRARTTRHAAPRSPPPTRKVPSRASNGAGESLVG